MLKPCPQPGGSQDGLVALGEEVRVAVMGVSAEPAAEAREPSGGSPCTGTSPTAHNSVASVRCCGSVSWILNEIVLRVRSDTCNVPLVLDSEWVLNK